MTASTRQDLPNEFLDRLRAVKNKRARAVIEHILEHGSVSTEVLKNVYGYDHSPRAAKDVRDEAIPLVTFRVRSASVRSIAAYRFGDPVTVLAGRQGVRRQFSKRSKQILYERSGGRCSICNGAFTLRELQVDHRVPYEIAGALRDPDLNLEEFMLVCGPCNRAKSWSCEHCPNWLERDVITCLSCYWANPLEYVHVATKSIRRTDIMWHDREVELHDKLKHEAESEQASIQEYIKRLLQGLVFLTV
jgi:hypothetical protein